MRSPWCVLLLLLPGLLSAQTNDWLVIPGERVGPVLANTVRADLRHSFAPGASIEEDAIELDEGIVQPATLIQKDVQSESLAIIWDGKGAGAHPLQIFICRGRRRGPCRWHLANGITDGTKMLELERLNGKPFTISGFGMGYGGNVQAWDGGRLETLECNGRLTLTLDGERQRGGVLTTELTSEERHSITGDKPVPSTTPAMRKVNPVVTEMVFYFPGANPKPCAAR